MRDRTWLTTDRPGERVAIGSALRDVTLMSVRHSARCWADIHTSYKVCLISPDSPIRAGYRSRGEHEITAGELMLFEPGDHHVTTWLNGEADFELLDVSPEAFAQDVRELGLRHAFHFQSVHLRAPDIARALMRFTQLVGQGAARLPLECAYAELSRLLIERCSESALPSRRSSGIPHARIRAVRDYLRENYLEEHTLADLAQRAGLSRFGFAHAFKQYVGLAPYAFLKLCRVSEARRRIERGLPIGEVASALRFSDVPALSRALRSRVGAPPARWRRCFQSNSALALG